MPSVVQSSLISKVRHELRHNSWRTTIGKAAQSARARVYLDRTYIWYELSLRTDRPRASLPSGLTLIRGDKNHLALLGELPSVHEWLARERLEAGNDLWLVLGRGRPVFACWTLHGATPLLAAPEGRLALPSDVVGLENSATSVSYRGRGVIAPSAWSQIADRLEKTGVKSIITKLEDDNKVMRWALARSGFREVASTHYRRVGFRQHATVRGEGATADWIAGQLKPRG
jgi:hypothetical protein